MTEVISFFLTNTLFLELFGFFLNMLYLFFVIKEKAVGWIWSILASIIFFWICYNSRLYIQAGLYAFYIFIAILGTYKWHRKPNIPITSLTKSKNVSFFFTYFLLGLIFGFVFSEYTDQSLPYLDGVISAFAVGTTLLVISKQSENWLYWIAINLASIGLYSFQELYVLACMSFVLLLFAVYGFMIWSKKIAID